MTEERLVLAELLEKAGDVVKVGLIASYTGAFAIWGSQFQQAVKAYQALHGNTVKGPAGPKFIVNLDATGCDPCDKTVKIIFPRSCHGVSSLDADGIGRRIAVLTGTKRESI
jgi:hypothetical protein